MSDIIQEFKKMIELDRFAVGLRSTAVIGPSAESASPRTAKHT